MKKSIVVAVAFLFSSTLWGQNADTPAAKLAHYIADKMADSLSLTSQQRSKVFSINMELHKQKAEARKKSTDRSVVGKELQIIEGARDSFYKSVLTEQQFELYLQKKRTLVRSK